MNALLEAYPDCPDYFELALTFNGLKERAKDGTLEPRVRAMFEHTRFPPDLVNVSTAWCAAFCCAMLERKGYKSPHSAAAKSFLMYGKRSAPVVGAFVVMPRTGGSYHVTMWAGQAGPKFLGYGGNQRDGVCMQLYNSSAILDCRVPT